MLGFRPRATSYGGQVYLAWATGVKNWPEERGFAVSLRLMGLDWVFLWKRMFRPSRGAPTDRLLAGRRAASLPAVACAAQQWPACRQRTRGALAGTRPLGLYQFGAAPYPTPYGGGGSCLEVRFSRWMHQPQTKTNVKQSESFEPLEPMIFGLVIIRRK